MQQNRESGLPDSLFCFRTRNRPWLFTVAVYFLPERLLENLAAIR